VEKESRDGLDGGEMQRTIQTGIWSFERLSFVQLCKTVVLSEKQEKLPNVEARGISVNAVQNGVIKPFMAIKPCQVP
jgi:hypothetical protein